MSKKIIVVGYHQSVKHAERNLSRLLRKHGAESGRILARRNDRGRFSNRGRNFTFELLTKSKRRKKKPSGKLYRFTIAITYPRTTKGQRKGGYYGYYLKHWSGSKKHIGFKSDRERELIDVTVQGLEKHLGYPRSRFWFDLQGVTSIEQPTLTTDNVKRGTWELFSDEEGSEVVGKFSSLREVKEFVKSDEENDSE